MKRKFKSMLMLGLVLLCYSNLQAQEAFEWDRIILKSSDTLQGKVSWPGSANKKLQGFDFKQTGSKTAVHYTKDQVSEVLMANQSKYSSELSEDGFIEVLVEGHLSLGLADNVYYLIKKGQPVRKMTYNPDRIAKTANSVVQNDYRYIGVAKLVTGDCLVGYDFNKLKFEQQSFTQLVIDYNQCKTGEYTDVKENLAWVKPSFGIGAGVSLQSFKFAGALDLGYQNEQIVNHKQLAAVVGVDFRLNFPKVERHFGVGMGVQVSAMDSGITWEENNGGVDLNLYSELSFIRLSIPLYIDYSLELNQKNGMNFSAGLSFDRLLNAHSLFIEQQIYPTIIQSLSNEDQLNLSQGFQSFYLRTQYERKLGKLRVQGALELQTTAQARSISSLSSLSYTIVNFQIKLAL